MSNRPSWAKKRKPKEPRTIDVHVDPSKIRKGHGVSLVTKYPIWHIRCVCGKEWKAPSEIKDAIERQAFEHVYEVASA